MRKIKLQMQMTLDGFVTGPNGEMDWMWLSGERDEAGINKVIELADTCDTILMGRKMAPGFVSYWESVVDNQPENPDLPLAQRMVNMPKVVFSKTLTTMEGRNLRIENGDLVTAIQALKDAPGKDIMVYGGAHFASSLISHDLVDEYYIFRNPVAIGNGQPIFNERRVLKLEDTISYKNGKVLNKYVAV